MQVMLEDDLDPENIRVSIVGKVSEVEEMFGQEAAFFYQAGFMDAVELISELADKRVKRTLNPPDKPALGIVAKGYSKHVN